MTLEEALKVAESAKDSVLPRGEALRVLKEEYLKLQSEHEELNNNFETFLNPDLLRLAYERGELKMDFEGGVCRLFAAMFAYQFKEIGATNFVEMSLISHDADIGELILTLQRKQGKTPNQLKVEAEEKYSKCAAGEWKNYPDNKPENEGAYWCVVDLESKEAYMVCYWEENDFMNFAGNQVDVIRFAEIR